MRTDVRMATGRHALVLQLRLGLLAVGALTPLAVDAAGSRRHQPRALVRAHVLAADPRPGRRVPLGSGLLAIDRVRASVDDPVLVEPATYARDRVGHAGRIGRERAQLSHEVLRGDQVVRIGETEMRLGDPSTSRPGTERCLRSAQRDRQLSGGSELAGPHDRQVDPAAVGTERERVAVRVAPPDRTLDTPAEGSPRLALPRAFQEDRLPPGGALRERAIRAAR